MEAKAEQMSLVVLGMIPENFNGVLDVSITPNKLKIGTMEIGAITEGGSMQYYLTKTQTSRMVDVLKAIKNQQITLVVSTEGVRIQDIAFW